MDNWQFFLQKEGDYAWLPLEAPQVEILEGRYQLIAHTQNCGPAVRVHIRHHYEQENIPQANIQETIRPVEVSGKVVILPQVYLGLGSWQICCSPESQHLEPQRPQLKSDCQPSSYSLDIQVLPQDFDLFEDWSFSESALIETAVEGLQPPFSQEEGIVFQSQPMVTAFSLLAQADAACDRADSDEFSREESPDPASLTLDTAMLASSVLDNETEVQVLEVEPTCSTPSHKTAASESLELPQIPSEIPPIYFRTVSPRDLPRPVSDRPLAELDEPRSPQLPPFTQSEPFIQAQGTALRNRLQRERILSRIKLIASAVGQKSDIPELSQSLLQEKFHSTLNQLAVKSVH